MKNFDKGLMNIFLEGQEIKLCKTTKDFGLAKIYELGMNFSKNEEQMNWQNHIIHYPNQG